VTLLEEPQAALYSWIERSAGSGARSWAGDLILVVDVGGGTTDFSLIAVLEHEGELELHRIAVGDHILLGGDNMDLTLAYAREAQARDRRAHAGRVAAARAHARLPHAKERC
jgi:molecular chaperone DnaK (HSP70)